MRTNVRLVSTTIIKGLVVQEVGGEYVVRVDVPKDMLRVTNDLHAYQSEEPAANWHLEYRGEGSTWHRAEGDAR